MKEEEVKKGYTDCVYFLASPLTCKRGIECEYRHSEIARLNPRDCWYWLAGCCLNLNCAFRHPPLDGHMEASYESTTQYDSNLHVNKTNVPCYFYFNGFCNKGERCSFMHGPDDGGLTIKSKEIASTVNDAADVNKKMATRSDTGRTPIETQICASETVIRGTIEPQNKVEYFHQFARNSNVPENSFPYFESDSDEAAIVGSEKLPPAEGFVENRSLICTDQSSEDQVDCHVEREEWLESSPGFDVIVDDGLEDVVYEDGPEYVLSLDAERKELNNRFLGYHYASPVEYDPDAGNIYEEILHHSYDHLDDEHKSDHIKRSPRQSRERVFDRLLLTKRKFTRTEKAYNGNSMDLRDHLKRRRLGDGHSLNHLSRRHYSSHLIGQIKERPQWEGSQRYHGKLASHAEKIVRSRSDELALSDVSQQGRLRRSRQQYKARRPGKQQILLSQVTRKSARMTRISTEESSVFTGPKTLDQIKEEKKKKNAHENGDSLREVRSSSRASSEDFQGPKPLNKILEDKRRLVSVISSCKDCM